MVHGKYSIVMLTQIAIREGFDSPCHLQIFDTASGFRENLSRLALVRTDRHESLKTAWCLSPSNKAEGTSEMSWNRYKIASYVKGDGLTSIVLLESEEQSI